MAEAIFQKPLNKRIKRLIDGLTYQAVKSGNNWILPSGTNAAAGEYITVDGVLGQATSAIVGGTDAIVENTNWAPEGAGGAINALNSRFRYNTTNAIFGNDGTNLTAPSDGWFCAMNWRTEESHIYLDGERIDVYDGISGIKCAMACGFIKKGQVISGGARWSFIPFPQ